MRMYFWGFAFELCCRFEPLTSELRSRAAELVECSYACFAFANLIVDTNKHGLIVPRMEQRGTRLRIQLIMGAENLNMTRSRNTVAEITGSVYPEQVAQS